MNLMHSRSWILALAAGTCIAAVTLAQPAEPAASQPAHPDGGQGRPGGAMRERLGERMRERMDEGAPDAATLKQRLQRRLEENQKSSERLKAAIEKLEKGGNAEEILRELEMGRGGRDGGQGFGPDGGPRDGGRLPGSPEGGLGGPGGGPGGPGGGPGGMGRPGEGNPPNGPVTKEEMEAIHRFIGKHMPKVAERMKAFASLEPDAAERMTMRMAPRIRELMGLERVEPKLFDHRVDEMRAGFEIIASSRELSELVRNKGTEKDIADVEARVKDAVRARVEAQMKGQEAEIELLAKRVESLRQQLNERTASKDNRIADESKRVIERARDQEMRGPRGRGKEGPEKQEPQKHEPR